MQPTLGSAVGSNLLKNGDFEEGVLSPWAQSVTSPASGSIRVEQGMACAQILVAGRNSYDILIRQRPVAVKRHRDYVLRFAAQATCTTKLRPQIVLVGSPPHELWSAIVEVGPKRQTYAGQIKITEPVNVEAELVIHMGGKLQETAPVTICLDDVMLEEPGSAPSNTAAVLPKIRVNQLGYIPNLPKVATVKSTSATALEWRLANDSGLTLAVGRTKVFGEDRDAGELVHQIDFSNYRQPGNHLRLRVGDDQSDAFDIRMDIYRKLKYDAFAFFYQQRSGIDIVMPYAGSAKLSHRAGHLSDKNVACAPSMNCKYTLDVAGGWYDAGDHGKYVVNGGISVWTLLNWYERTKALGTSINDFGDGKFAIPENANRAPDLLDEVRWELEFLMKMQVPQGNELAGMAHHKIHGENWTPIPTDPESDTTRRFLRPPSTAATLNLAAAAAQCSRVFKDVDVTFSAKCLASAERAWQAAELHPHVYAPADDREGGGPYGDTDVTDEKYWAAAELFITTGASHYLKFVRQSAHYLKVPKQAGGGASSFSWSNVAACGTISLATVPSSLSRADVETARKNVASAAEYFLDASIRSGYRVPLPAVGGRYPWGSNSFVLNNGVVLALAYDFTRKPVFLDGALDALDYLLGRNPMAQSYVTSFGTRSLRNPHHRFWACQADPQFPCPPPGIVSGGPNSGVEDPAAKAAGLGGCAPQKCYFDDVESWSTNEVAINWNAPLAWLAAFMDEKAQESSGPK
jgi:endoglucanase